MRSITIDISESHFQGRVTTLAVDLGWEWMHIGRVGKYVANGAKGTLGLGWPDLSLVRIRDRRLVFVELKAQRSPPPNREQRQVLNTLELIPGVEVYVWRPADWPIIMEVLS